jgi:hypothetical protein
MKVYIYDYGEILGAGHWVYKGYQKAWERLGYDVLKLGGERFAVDSFYEDYIVMLPDASVFPGLYEMIEKSHKTFVYAQPNVFPDPWGKHPNFKCLCHIDTVSWLNEQNNVYLWSFSDIEDPSLFHKWKKVNTTPLAFDSVSYEPVKDERYTKYDVCFIGGWANNGFNEKRKIMLECFKEFKDSGLNCAFSVGKNISHEQENAILCNSKVALNIHDAYQRKLGFDTNERTFKSLGLNGILVSDEVRQLETMFPNVKTSNDPVKMIEYIKDHLSLTEKELNDIKEENRQNILDNHCYTHRVEQLLRLEND